MITILFLYIYTHKNLYYLLFKIIVINKIMKKYITIILNNKNIIYV